LEENKKALNHEVESLTLAFKTQNANFEQKTIDLQKNHDNNLDIQVASLKQSQVEEMQLLLTDFDRAKAYLKQQIEIQKKLLEEAAIKYINREPRDADIKTIEELHMTIKERKAKEQELLVSGIDLRTSLDSTAWK
jgi:hypothetical protein